MEFLLPGALASREALSMCLPHIYHVSKWANTEALVLRTGEPWVLWLPYIGIK